MPNAGVAPETWECESPKIERWPDHTHQELSVEEDPGLKAEIAQARKILELSNDWDGAGSQAYSEDTFNRATAFLNSHSEYLNKHGLSLPVPNIGPGPDGSIDLHWKRPSWELLVNIPARADEMAVFYGDNYGVQKIRGSLDPSTFNFGIATWLMS